VTLTPRPRFLDARATTSDPPRLPGDRGAGVQIPAPEPACPEELDEERIAAQPEVARVLDRHHRKPVRRRQRLVEHADDLPRKARDELPPELPRAAKSVPSTTTPRSPGEKAAGPTGSSR
jgi:hypothetical protein